MGRSNREVKDAPKGLLRRLKQEKHQELERAVRDTPPKVAAGSQPPPEGPGGKPPSGSEANYETRQPTRKTFAEGATSRSPAERAIDRARADTRKQLEKRDAMRPYVKERAIDEGKAKVRGPVDRNLDTSRVKKTVNDGGEYKKPDRQFSRKTEINTGDGKGFRTTEQEWGTDRRSPESPKRLGGNRAADKAPATEAESASRWSEGVKRSKAKVSVERRKKIVEEGRRPWNKLERTVRTKAGKIIKAAEESPELVKAGKNALRVAKAAGRGYMRNAGKIGLAGIASAAAGIAAETETGKKVIAAANRPIGEDFKRAGKAIEDWKNEGGTVKHPTRPRRRGEGRPGGGR